MADTYFKVPVSIRGIIRDSKGNIKNILVTSVPDVQSLTDIIDVPSEYTGHGGDVVSIKLDETGIEFTNKDSLAIAYAIAL